MPNTIMTKCGEIRGTTCQWDGVVAYKGIRYATAGRWKYPDYTSYNLEFYDGIIARLFQLAPEDLVVCFQLVLCHLQFF